MPDLFSDVRCLQGVGASRAAQLEKLGVRTLYDLIAYFPRSYEDRTRISAIADLQAGVPACFEAMVTGSPRTAHIRKGLDLTKVVVADHSAKLHITFFNQSYVADQLRYGEPYLFYGAIDNGSMQMLNPVFEPLATAGTVTKRILPVYALTAGLSNKMMVRLVRQALDACAGSLPEVLPAPLREQYGLCGVEFAYAAIHDPPSFPDLERARRRIIFEEFFIFSAGLSMLKAQRGRVSVPALTELDLTEFYSRLPYTPTGAQQRAIDEILQDLRSGTPMNRLVQGDVGSGKTLVAAAAAVAVLQNGRQAALMAPTEILAEQHAKSLSPLLEALGFRTVLLTGSLRAAEKSTARAAIADGSAGLVIGTHALLSDATVFSDLGLVIADEQHRFGVSQRAALARKGQTPHLLFLSATPIPRTLALILYGDLDVSVIDQRPPGRQEIDTFLVNESYRARLNGFIRRQTAEGHQVYIVCPAIEESETADLKSAEVWAQTLQSTVFPDLRVALLHGKMSGSEKEAVMRRFAAGEVDILVATTVIEVGVDVPNATLMVVENADRFGLSQLHQLRGRVGRGSAKSYCILLSDTRSEETRARLKALCKTNDGFKISEADLALRGPGDFFGSRQHGLPDFKAANLSLDLLTLRQAQDACAEFFGGEIPDTPEYQPLYARIRALFRSGDAQLN